MDTRNSWEVRGSKIRLCIHTHISIITIIRLYCINKQRLLWWKWGMASLTFPVSKRTDIWFRSRTETKWALWLKLEKWLSQKFFVQAYDVRVGNMVNWDDSKLSGHLFGFWLCWVWYNLLLLHLRKHQMIIVMCEALQPMWYTEKEFQTCGFGFTQRWT